MLFKGEARELMVLLSEKKDRPERSGIKTVRGMEGAEVIAKGMVLRNQN